MMILDSGGVIIMVLLDAKAEEYTPTRLMLNKAFAGMSVFKFLRRFGLRNR